MHWVLSKEFSFFNFLFGALISQVLSIRVGVSEMSYSSCDNVGTKLYQMGLLTFYRSFHYLGLLMPTHIDLF